MKRELIFLSILMAAIPLIAAAAPVEELNYKVLYHLAFINKTAGHGTIKLQCSGDTLHGTLTGRSIDWGGRYYSVADTLCATLDLTVADSIPRQKVVSVSGWYTKPTAEQLAAGTYDRTDPANYRTIAGQGNLSADPSTMEAISITANMLGLFQFFKLYDLGAMKENESLSIPIAMPDGSNEYVFVTYLGPSTYYDTKDHDTYHVRFEYSYKGKNSNYPVDCQVDRATRYPLLLSSSLPIGKLEMILEQ